MAVYSTNQNRQFYVAIKENEDLIKKVVKKGDKLEAEVGDIAYGELKKDGADKPTHIFFKHYGHGGLTRTDLIDINKICYVNITPAEALVTKLKEATIKLSPDVNGGTPIVGQDYIVRIIIRNYLAPGDNTWTVKHGAVHVTTKTTDPQKFYEKLAESLTMNFSREVQPLLEFEATPEGVKVTEVEQPWNLGLMSQDTVNFEIVATTVRYNGEEVVWADTEDGYIEVTESEDEKKALPNSKKIADLEYFCMGERGDQYRDNVSRRLAIPTKRLVDGENEKGYDVLDIHYFFSDTGVNVQKSEKDLTIVAEAGSDILDTLAGYLKAYDIAVTKTPVKE